jgi:hypothetical protein
VVHPKFGIGIVDEEYDGGNEVLVHFEPIGSRRVVISFLKPSVEGN